MEGEWRIFKEAVLKRAENVCEAKRCNDGGTRGEGYWWTKEVKSAITEKRRLYQL